MAAWGLPLLFAALVSGTALATKSRKKKPGSHPLPAPPTGPGKAYTIDLDMPPAMEDQVLAALVQETDPSKLDAFASGIGALYPLSAAALRSKATALRAHVFVLPPNPLDFLATVPDPPRSQITQILLSVNDPNQLEGIAVQFDAMMPLAAIALRAKAALIRAGQAVPSPAPSGPSPLPSWPQPAAVQPQPGPAPMPLPAQPPPWVDGPAPAPPAPPPASVQPPPQQPPAQQPPWVPSPAPTPPSVVQPPPPQAPPPPAAPQPPVWTGPPTPPPSLPGLPAGLPMSLDPGMPPEMQKAVLGALTTENDPAKLQGFATLIQATYPMAAGMLAAKANALLLARGAFPPTPAPTPGGVVVPSPPPAQPSGPATPPPPPAFPLGSASTHAGKNSGRPMGQYPFVVLGTSGQGNAPVTLAKVAVGDEAQWPTLKPLNPQYRFGVDPEWVGQALNVPWEWAAALHDNGYVIQQDPGAQPPPNFNASARRALPAHAPAALLPGGPHVAHA